MDFDFQDRIDDYLLNRMSEEEKTQFEQEVNLDIEKNKQLELTRNVKIAIGSRQEKLKILEELKNRYDIERCHVSQTAVLVASSAPRITNRKSLAIFSVFSARKKILPSILGVAAVFVIGIFIIIPSMFRPVSNCETSPSEILRGDDEVFESDQPVLVDTLCVEADEEKDNVIIKEYE